MLRCAPLAFALGLGLCMPALAQVENATPPEVAPRKLDPKACSDRDRLTLGDTQELQSRGTSGESTSDKLARTGGVICPPPGLDPDIRAPAPGSGRMRVILPPGSVGGDPSAQPK